jgi:hypothetical protein
VRAVRGTMGKETSIELYAVDANCLDAIEISIRQEDLPPGAVLHTKPPPNLQCTHARSTLTWYPYRPTYRPTYRLLTYPHYAHGLCSRMLTYADVC